MKIASLNLILLVLIVYSCEENPRVINTFQNKNSSFISYEIDTAFYSFNIMFNETKDTFAVVRDLYVSDSSFGIFNPDNLQKAIDFCTKSKIEFDRIYLRYFISIQEQNHLKQLWFINYPNYDILYYPVLEEGIADKPVPNEPNKSFEDYHYLRVIDKNKSSLDMKCLNFRYNHNLWTLISKEILTSDTIFPTKYCIDTTSKHINGEGASGLANYIDFFGAFSRNYWDCK